MCRRVLRSHLYTLEFSLEVDESVKDFVGVFRSSSGSRRGRSVIQTVDPDTPLRPSVVSRPGPVPPWTSSPMTLRKGP